MTNVLLITADDMDGYTPFAFGGAQGVTPNLDRLASEGMTFHRAHVVAAICQPSRSSIMTGLLPHKNGAEGFQPIDDGIEVMSRLLVDHGFRAGILGKVDHLQPVERFAWDFAVEMRSLGLGRDPKAYGKATGDFLQTAADEGRPWFLMANAHDPHRPFHSSESEREKWTAEERALYPAPSQVFTSEDVENVPGFLPDLPAIREEYAQYLSSARRCDDTVGEILAALEESGQAEDTLVVFLSDNGMAFPFAKANCYLRSTLTPLIVRWPGVAQAGSTNVDSFSSMLDLFPTFCEAVGIDAPAGLDGRSLLPLIRGAEESGRERVFTVFHETGGKRRLEMRCVQDARYGYIWNQWSNGETEYRAENMEGLTWSAMMEASSNAPQFSERVALYLTRVPEELYDLAEDPDCLVNLVDSRGHERALEESRSLLEDWMLSKADPLHGAFVAHLAHR